MKRGLLVWGIIFRFFAPSGAWDVAAQPLFPVPDTVSVEEACARFVQWHRGDSGCIALPLHRVSTRHNGEVLLWPDYRCESYYLDTRQPEALQRAGKADLPASTWTLLGNYTAKGKRIRLCWQGARTCDAACLPGGKTHNRLAKRYGRYARYGVPARWFSGSFGLSTHYRLYGGVPVCRYVRLYAVEKGVIRGTTMLQSHPCLPGHASAGDAQLYPWSRYGGREFQWLADSLASATPRMKKYNGRTTFSLLLYEDASGTLRCIPLTSEPLNHDEAEVTYVLSRAVRKLSPMGMFSQLVTTDGRIFPFRYLWATYHPVVSGKRLGKWSFTDYLEEEGAQDGGE